MGAADLRQLTVFAKSRHKLPAPMWNVQRLTIYWPFDS
jgi:hypothetical protein